MARVLITGFEPSPGATADSSADAVRILADTWHGAAELIARRLPAAFEEAPRRLRASIAKHLPDAVIVVACDPGSAVLAVERLAVNLDDATVPDAAGIQPVDRPVVPGAAAALWTTLPAKRIVSDLQSRGIPARLSLSAGSHVANHVFYALQRELAEWGVPSGLVHVPATPEMELPGVPSVPAPVIAEALRTTVDSVLASLAAPDAATPRERPTERPEQPATGAEPVDGYDPEATQAYLMPIREPVVESPSRPQQPLPPAPVAPTPIAPPPVASTPVPPDVGEVPALEPDPQPGTVAVTAPSAPSADSAPEADGGDAPEPPATRPMTWDEIITGGGR